MLLLQAISHRAAACFAFGSPIVQVLGAGMFFLYYLFDYCDGELARLRGMGSRFGAAFDDFTDWVVHAAFFLAVGYHTMAEAGSPVCPTWAATPDGAMSPCSLFADWRARISG